MHKTIISDTSCLIVLEKIGELDILSKLFGTIITTLAVAAEFGKPLPSWFELKKPTDKNYQTIIEASVDKGEASAIALAVELEDCLLIIDDLKGRKICTATWPNYYWNNWNYSGCKTCRNNPFRKTNTYKNKNNKFQNYHAA